MKLYGWLLTSAAIMKLATRVRFAWNASAMRSNIRRMCSSNWLGMPEGASGSSRVLRSRDAICCARRSISRTVCR